MLKKLSDFIPTWWKAGLVLVACLAVGGSVMAAYVYAGDIRDKLIQTTADLAKEQVVSAVNEKTNEALRDIAEKQRTALQELEATRSQIQAKTQTLRSSVRRMPVEKDFKRDPNKAVRDLDARNRELDRMLEQASSGSARSEGGGAGNKEGSAGSSRSR